MSSAMEEYLVAVGPNGEVQLPPAICQSLGIIDETRVALWIEGNHLVLELDQAPAHSLPRDSSRDL